MTTAERLQRLSEIVHQLHHTLKVRGEKSLLDATLMVVEKEKLSVPRVLITFTCLFVASDVRSHARSKKEFARAMRGEAR